MHAVIIIILVNSPPPIISRTFIIRTRGVVHGWRSQTVYTTIQSFKNSKQKKNSTDSVFREKAEIKHIHIRVERTTFVAEQYKLSNKSLLRPTLAKSCLYIPRAKSAARELVSNACSLAYRTTRVGYRNWTIYRVGPTG